MIWVIIPSGGEYLVKERETLGEYLKRERELKNISLRELAKKTKVREHLLKAIEEDKIEFLPSPVYIKGFLSAYAKSIGLDPHEVLLRYELSLKGEPVISLEVKPERKPEKKREKKPKGKPDRAPLKKFLSSRKQIWMISGVIIISFLISYFFHPYLSGPPVETPPGMQEANKTVPIIPNTQTHGGAPAIEEKPFLLEVKAVERTWIKIQVDGQPPAEILLKPGETESYQAIHRIELLIGNAGGLDIVFNGQMIQRFGKSGEVVAVVFTPQGAERKRL
jgi:cytoskeletal protein RodZ